MSFKNILVHLANDPHHGARLDAALALVDRFGAHLKVLYTATPIDMPAAVEGRGASYSYIMQQAELAREKAAALEKELTERYADKLSYDFSIEEGDPLELLAEHAHYADLAVVTQTSQLTFEDKLRLQLPIHLPVLAGCPVLILPENDFDVSQMGKHPLIAWKANKAANRAVRDALPFLSDAEKVTVLSVQRNGDDGAALLETFLNAHGIKAEFVAETGGDGVAADRILRTATAHDNDLIVMGGYGHSRLHYMVGAGVTSYVTSHSPVPILMSH